MSDPHAHLAHLFSSARRATIWDKLVIRLNRAPTNAECKAEMQRILGRELAPSGLEP